MLQSTSGYIYALFHTMSDQGISVLLTRRHLLRTWAGGRTIRAEVPNWAGQWGLLAAKPLVTQSVEATIQGAVASQMGIDLSAAESAERYRVVNFEQRTLTDEQGINVTVVLLTCLPEGLETLAADAAANLASRKVEDGVLASVEIQAIGAANARVRPCEEPQGGWEQFVREHRLGALANGSYGSQAALARQLRLHSGMGCPGARAGLAILDQLPIAQPRRHATLKALAVFGAHPLGDDSWYQTWSPGEIVLVQAVTEPPGAEVTWTGGIEDPLQRSDWRALPRDRVTDPAQPLFLVADLDERRLQVQLSVVPRLLGVACQVMPTPDQAVARLRLQARLAPDNPLANRYLVWKGGESLQDQGGNVRQCDIDALATCSVSLLMDRPDAASGAAHDAVVSFNGPGEPHDEHIPQSAGH